MAKTKTAHYRDDIYLDKIIKEKFTGSFMNNAKWVRLISVLVNNLSEVKLCRVKPIWDEKEAYRRLILNENTAFGFDYYDTAMEAMISDKPTGWYAYKEIQWLDFPKFIESDGTTVQQNIYLIKQIIECVGQYKLELTENNLRLYAYYA